jgi:predicted SAM-dependent methyltransferase
MPDRPLRAQAARLRPGRIARSLVRRGRALLGRSPAGAAVPTRARLGPNEPGGLRRIHVGSGPEHLLEDWWNVDVRRFPGVDEVLDATQPWPWSGLEAVYGEHFLEHLPLEGALDFLDQAAAHLRPGGILRLSTPSIEWVWATHLSLDPADDPRRRIAQTYAANRAFHGWGHRFLYSQAMLERLLVSAGFVDLSWHAFGESEVPGLRGLERHGGYTVRDGWPSVWIVEAVRGERVGAIPSEVRAEAEEQFVRYVRGGH